MGMSASQARYLSLTARRNNNEYQAQQIAQQRTMLAMQMDQVATDYTKKLSNRQLLFTEMDPTANKAIEQRLTYDIITSTNPFSGLGMRVVDLGGQIVVPNPPSNDYNKMMEDATNAYTKALSNNCFTTDVVDQNGSPAKLTYTGENFLSSYLSGLNNDITQNLILDKDGNAVDFDQFKDQVKLLNAPDFYDFWKDNQLSFQNNDILTEERKYTEDDAQAEAKYKQDLANIDDQRNVRYAADLNCLDADYLENKLRTGEWILEKRNPNIGDGGRDWVSTPWTSEARIGDSLDKTDDAEAEAEYTQRSQFFKNQDKTLELMMKQLDTEHGALQTEMDSVKKVVDKNVEGSFKTFG